MARCLPQLGQRRGPRAGPHERRHRGDGPSDAAAGRRTGRRRHPRHLAGRLRRGRAAHLGLRPDALRPRGASQPGLPLLLRHQERPVPRGGGQPHRPARHLRHREHRPAARQVPGTDRRQERLHHQRGQHLRRGGPARRAHAAGRGHAPRHLYAGLRRDRRPAGLGLRGGRPRDAGRQAGHPEAAGRDGPGSAASPLAAAPAPAKATGRGGLAGPGRRPSLLGPETWTVAGTLSLCAAASLWLLRRRQRGLLATTSTGLPALSEPAEAPDAPEDTGGATALPRR